MPVILLIIGELVARSDDLAEAVLWYLPYFYLIEGTNRLSPTFEWFHTMYLPGSRGDSSTAAGFLMAVFWVGVAHLGVAAAILWVTIRHFDRYVGRAGQLRPEYPTAGALAGSL
jgi:hypothetical protein